MIGSPRRQSRKERREYDPLLVKRSGRDSQRERCKGAGVPDSGFLVCISNKLLKKRGLNETQSLFRLFSIT